MKNKLSPEVLIFFNKATTQNFLKATTAFVELLEIKDIDIKTFQDQVYNSLVKLYAAGAMFEQIQMIVDNDYDRDKLFHNHNANKILELEGAVLYWDVVETIYSNNTVEAGLGDLEDDLADIYRDLKIELEKIKLQTDNAIIDALWQMKFSFQHHWGIHCIAAIKHLHNFIYR